MKTLLKSFHDGHFQINTECITTDSFYTTVFGDENGVYLDIEESTNDYSVNLRFDVKSAKKLITQLEKAVRDAGGSTVDSPKVVDSSELHHDSDTYALMPKQDIIIVKNEADK